MAAALTSEHDLDELYLQSLLLGEVVKRILEKKAEIYLSSKPQLVKKNITEFMKKMRVTGLSKFEGRTYISTVNFYLSDEDLESHEAIGAIVLYLPEIHIVKILQDLGYPVIDEDDEDALEDACGSFCNMIAGSFKAGLSQLGYEEIVMSHFSSYQNDVINGVEYSHFQHQLFEVSFEIKGEKMIVADLTLDQVPKISES